MKTIGLIINEDKPRADDILRRICETCGTLKLEPVLCETMAGTQAGKLDVIPAGDAGGRVDAVVAMGGDGTMLHAAKLLRHTSIPILGVNLGKLGFLTSIPIEQLDEALEALAAGTFKTSRRSLMYAKLVRNGAEIGSFHALNDIVAGWGQSTRIMTFDVTIDAEDVTSYRCDGVILSTPTGSTGHSLSAGGPILHPETPAFLLNVICPHSLSARPIIIPDNRDIVIRARDTQGKLHLSVDGQEERELQEQDELHIRKAAEEVSLIHLSDYSYFSVLRRKLQWSGSSASITRR